MPRPTKEINPIFADRIKEARKELGLTQEELAEKLFVSAGAVRNWEQGKNNVDDSNLELIEKLALQQGNARINYAWLKGLDITTVIESSRSILSSFVPTENDDLATLLDSNPIYKERFEFLLQCLYLNGHTVEEIHDLKLFREYMESSIKNSIAFYISNLNKEKEMENKNKLAPKEKEFLVTPEEAIRLGLMAYHETIDFVTNLEKMFLADVADDEAELWEEEEDDSWKHDSILAIVFEAGRIQGIREQRKKILEKNNEKEKINGEQK